MQALEVATTNDIDVLLTDVGLPDIPGNELAKRLRARKPQVGIVFATGHNEVAGFDGQPKVGLLKKPFQLSQLANVLAAVTMSAPVT